ncbi:g3176 [Coccomyxa viridis]|uniref:G3176 protein n=1 Tax=Coccomyxa viridis TaxID=1274662 RepID=A0ABP1FSB4_9CHLO
MLSALVKLLEQMTGHERLVLTVYGTTKVTAADFTTSATPNVKTALLPLVWNCVRLRDEVDAFPSITWGTLYKEGLFNPLFAGYQWDAPNPMPPAHSEVSVATAVGDLQLCPPTRDPTALWCTVQVCPLALKLLAPDALE